MTSRLSRFWLCNCFFGWILFSSQGDAGPIVGAEGGGGQFGLVEEVGLGGVGPAVTNGQRPLDLTAADDDGVVIDGSLGGVEFLVGTGDGEVGEGAIFGDQTAVDVVE